MKPIRIIATGSALAMLAVPAFSLTEIGIDPITGAILDIDEDWS